MSKGFETLLEFEDAKWKLVDEKYFTYIQKLQEMQLPSKEIVYNIPAYVGQVNLARTFFFYELYKQVLNLSGDIAEVGIYKGASFLLWAKLIKLFEPYNTTQVYGFDWFKGMVPGDNDNDSVAGDYQTSYEKLSDLVKLQQLQDVALIVDLDITKDAAAFIESRPWLRFKLLFIDCGIEDVLKNALEYFYPRLVRGGILIMDHYNLSCSPTESDLVDKYTKGHGKLMQMPFNRHSSAYLCKQED